jgi:hypothetical protein
MMDIIESVVNHDHHIKGDHGIQFELKDPHNSIIWDAILTGSRDLQTNTGYRIQVLRIIANLLKWGAAFQKPYLSFLKNNT